MFDRFTHRSKLVMNLSRQESQRFNHEYLGTEHMLLALATEGTGVGASVLKQLGVDLSVLRADIENALRTSQASGLAGQLPFTIGAREALKRAMEAAGGFGHSYIGTEHLLMGLVQDDSGGAGRALTRHGVQYARARAEVVQYLVQYPNRGVAQDPLYDSKGATSVLPHPQRLMTFKVTLDQLRLLGEHAAADALEQVIRTLERESH